MLQILNIVSDLQNCSVNNTVVNRRSIFYYDIWWPVSLLGHSALPQNIEEYCSSRMATQNKASTDDNRHDTDTKSDTKFDAISRSNVVAFQFDSWPCDLIRKGKETLCLLFFINPPNPKVNTKFVSLCPTFRALLLRETKESQIKSSNWFPVLYFWAIYVGMIPSKLQCIRNISTGLVTLS